MNKKILVAVLVLSLVLSMFAGCGAESSDGGKEKIVFWHCDGNPISDPLYEEVIKRFETANPQYDVEYVGIANSAFMQKYTTALSTGNAPDVMTMYINNVAGFTALADFVNLDNELKDWSEFKNFSKAPLDDVRSKVSSNTLHMMPMQATLDVMWVNTKWHEEHKEKVPTTISEYLALCEKYADPVNGTYYTTLRGGAGGCENLWDFMMTYADMRELFDKDGNCLIDSPKCAEAVDAYASIYKNNWASKDSISNGFKQIVAEFGSKTAPILMHNSSSLSEHKKNLGDGNFMSYPILKNDAGNSVSFPLSTGGYAVPADAKNTKGGVEFLKYLCSAEGSGYLTQGEGRIPLNSAAREQTWYSENPYYKAYTETLEDEKFFGVPFPLHLSNWYDIRGTVQEPGLQAVMMGKKTGAEFVKEFAAAITESEKAYRANNK